MSGGTNREATAGTSGEVIAEMEGEVPAEKGVGASAEKGGEATAETNGGMRAESSGEVTARAEAVGTVEVTAESSGEVTARTEAVGTVEVTAESSGEVTARTEADGTIEVTARTYRLTVSADGLTATVLSTARPDDPPLLLQLAGAVDRSGAEDETLSVSPPRLDSGAPHPCPRITVDRRSTAWTSARTRIDCTPRGPQLRWDVTGSGDVTTVLPFAVRAALGGRGGGLRPSGHAWRTLFSPNPGPPRRLSRGAGESAVIGAYGDARPGRGNWFFTPAPLCFALTRDTLPDDADPAAAASPTGWWSLGVGAPADRLTFTRLAYVPSDMGFHLRLDYEGHTRVRGGTFTTPAVLVSPGNPDPYAALHAHRDWLAGHGWAADSRSPQASWWREPMFCGWGAQMARARETGLPAPELSTRTEYDAHLRHLAGHGLLPGTVVIDDKWQRAYGSWEPDDAKWPDLRGWIADRHAEGRRVLLWWRAWSTEGVPPELCVRTPDGHPVALDPDHPGARRHLAENISRMLAPGPYGLDADGLKIDFTADTPTGACLTHHGPHWGIALLHRQLAVIHAASKSAKPDSLVVTHTPHPAFSDVTDMIRLNDMLRLDDPDPYAPIVPQMRLRAAVANAADPQLLVDTDDWCAPDREQWREYCAMKHELGVPALYAVSRLDRTGEPLEERDYAALRESWERWRRGGERESAREAGRDGAPMTARGTGPRGERETERHGEPPRT